MFRKHVSFVARLSRVHVQSFSVRNDTDFAAKFGTIAAIQDDDAITQVANFFCQPLSRGSFARAADGDVAQTYDETIQPLFARKAEFVAEQT